MASLEDLKNVLRDTLEQKGALNQVKAQIRAEIFTALDAENTKGKPALPQENVMINELIREYLLYNGYFNTASVLVTESGSPVDPPFDRNYIERKLQIQGSPADHKAIAEATGKSHQQVPLMYDIVNGLQKNESKF